MLCNWHGLELTTPGSIVGRATIWCTKNLEQHVARQRRLVVSFSVFELNSGFSMRFSCKYGTDFKH